MADAPIWKSVDSFGYIERTIFCLDTGNEQVQLSVLVFKRYVNFLIFDLRGRLDLQVEKDGDNCCLCTYCVGSHYRQKYYHACLCGSCARLLREKTEIQSKNHIIVLAGLLLPLVAFFAGNLVFTSISFASFLIAVPQVERVKSIFECKLAKKLGAVSFGIYGLHWPIINSIGLRLIIAFTNRLRSDVVMLMALLCCVLLTLVLAALFRMTVEKLTARVCKIIH